MKIAFLMDKPDSINPLHDTTIHLMYECSQRGFTVYFLEAHDIYIRDNEVMSRLHKITTSQNLSMKDYWRVFVNSIKNDEYSFVEINDLDVLFIRKESFLHDHTIRMLAPARNRILMINSFISQIVGNGKLYTLHFPDIIPKTHVSRDPRRLKKIIDDFDGEMMIKPLQHPHGSGVIKVSKRDRENLSSIINYYVGTHQEYHSRKPIMVQEYLDAVRNRGAIRILLLNGKILDAMRMPPPYDDNKTGLSGGATTYKHEVTPQEQRICEIIQKNLKADGLLFVAVDIIDGKLIGIDYLCQVDIPQLNLLYNITLEKKVIDFIVQRVDSG